MGSPLADVRANAVCATQILIAEPSFAPAAYKFFHSGRDGKRVNKGNRIKRLGGDAIDIL